MNHRRNGDKRNIKSDGVFQSNAMFMPRVAERLGNMNAKKERMRLHDLTLEIIRTYVVLQTDAPHSER